MLNAAQQSSIDYKHYGYGYTYEDTSATLIGIAADLRAAADFPGPVFACYGQTTTGLESGRMQFRTLTKEDKVMSAGTIENVGNALKVKSESNGFLKYRSALIFASQAVLIVLTYYASFLLRLDTDLDAANRAMFWKTLPFVLVIKLVLSYQCGLMHGWWRYVGISDLLDISKASLLSSSLIFCLVEAVLRLPGYPRSVVVIDLFLTIMVLGGARFAVRAYTERART